MSTRNHYRIGDRLHTDGERTAPNGEAFDIKFIASTERLASDGGIIPVGAWRLDHFKNNPRFISNHDLSGWNGGITETVVGSVVDIRVETGLPQDKAPGGVGLVAYVRFANTDFAGEMRTLYMDGDLDAVSVRWDYRTEEIRSPTEEEADEHGRMLDWIAIRTDLMEISSVIIGADPGALALRGRVDEALARCRSKGIELPAIGQMRDRVASGELELPLETTVTETSLVDTAVVNTAITVTPAEFESLLAARADHVDSGALVDAITALRRMVEAWDLWAEQGFEIREALGDAANAFSALISGDEIGETVKVEDRSLGDIMDRARNSETVEELQNTLSEFSELFSAKLAELTGDNEDAETKKQEGSDEIVKDEALELFVAEDVEEDEDEIDVDNVHEEQEETGDSKEDEVAVEAADSDDTETEDPETTAKDTEDHEEQGGEESVNLAAVFGADEVEEAEKAA